MLIRGSEWGYFDNTKHLFFWLYNIKQLIFCHFNTNIKKIRWNKPRPKMGNIYVGPMFIVSKRFFWPFSNNSGLFQDFRRVRKISESCRRFPKAVEDVWRLPKMSEHCRRCPKTAEDVHWDCQRCPQTYDRRYLKTTADLACITHNNSILKALLQRGFTNRDHLERIY